jgi:mycothiol synthase
VARPYAGDSDWWAIRALLVDTRPRTPHGWNWDIRRWDGWRFHRAVPLDDAEMAATIGVWANHEGRVVAAIHPEGAADAYLELDPEYRNREPEMVAWAEQRLAAEGSNGRCGLEFWVAEEDTARRDLLARRGYRPDDSGGWMRCLRFDTPEYRPLPPAPIADGYELRHTRSTDGDVERMASLLNDGFGRTAHSAAEVRTFWGSSPSFEHELDLVAVAPDGSFAATAGLTYDAANRHGIVEPVCTARQHRRLGLARMLLIEGLRRLRDRGAVTASLDTGEGAAANSLYTACGFVEAHHFRAWRREL